VPFSSAMADAENASIATMAAAANVPVTMSDLLLCAQRTRLAAK
jgi:hypothetical protein